VEETCVTFSLGIKTVNYNFLKRADKLGGAIVCLFLTIFGRFFPKSKKEIKVENSIKKILIMKFWGLGSIVLASPAIKSLRMKYPDAEITFYTLSRNKEICHLLGLVDKVVAVELDQGIGKFIRDLLFTLFSLKKQHFDLLLDLEFFTRFSAILTYLINARISVGFDTWEVWRGNFHTVKVPYNRYWHMSKIFANLVSKIGTKIEFLELAHPRVSPADREFINEILEQNEVTNQHIVPVNVNSDPIGLERRWPKSYFVRLIDELIEKHNLKIVFIGSKTDIPYVQEMLSSLKNKNQIINLAGKINLSQLCALFEKSHFFISNDSGPLHLAVAMGLPTISFFGPETPVLYGPQGAKHLVFFKNIDCSPCMNVHSAKTIKCCKGSAECMESITVEEVVNEIEKNFFRK